MLQSDLCDYNDKYIVVKGTITVTGVNKDGKNRSLVLRNNLSFISCLSKINNVLIDNTEDLDVVMPMYSLIEYIKNYKKTTGILWNYYTDEPNNADRIANSASFKYKAILQEKYQIMITTIITQKMSKSQCH